jgi:transposase-like protein
MTSSGLPPVTPPEHEILKTDKLGRVRTPPDRREAILDAFERSGMPGTRFAAQHGINYQTFASWVQKRRRDRGDYGEAAHQGPKLTGPPALALAEVFVGRSAPQRAGEPPRSGSLRVELPGGAVLEVGDTRAAALAAELIRGLALAP